MLTWLGRAIRIARCHVYPRMAGGTHSGKPSVRLLGTVFVLLIVLLVAAAISREEQQEAGGWLAPGTYHEAPMRPVASTAASVFDSNQI